MVALTRHRLGEVVGQWPNADGDTSWAVVFASVVPTAGEMSAMREAARICDRVVVARLTPDRVGPPKLAETVREAGVDVLFMPKEVVGRVQVSLAGEKVTPAVVTLMMQTLLTVLPMVVVVSRADVEVIRVLRGITASMGDFFDMRLVD